MDFSTLKTMLALNLDDKNHEYYFEEPDLRLFLNNAYQFIYNELMRHNIFTKVSDQTINVVTNVQETVLTSPENIHKVVLVKDSEDIIVPIYNEAYSKRASVRSVYVAEYATPGSPNNRVLKLGWYIKPSSNFDLVVRTAQKVGQFAVGASSTYTIEDIPPEFHNVIVLYATILAVGKDEDNLQTWINLYNNEFETMLAGLGTKSEEAMEVVDYSYGEYYG